MTLRVRCCGGAQIAAPRKLCRIKDRHDHDRGAKTDTDHPPLQGEGRTAAGSPGWGGSGAAYAEALSPPLGPLARADLPPAEPDYGEGPATQQSDRSRQQPTSVGGGDPRVFDCLNRPI